MSHWLLVFSFFNLQIDKVKSDDRCPSSSYVYCADNHGICKIPGTFTKGFISYGSVGNFILIPFSIELVDGFQIGCSVTGFGEASIGITEYCCIIEEDHGFEREPAPDEGQLYNTFGTQRWYNIGDKFVVKDDKSAPGAGGFAGFYLYYVQEGNQLVHYSPFINNHGIETNAHSNNYNTRDVLPPSLKNIKWTLCGVDQKCTGLNPGSVHWMKYGCCGRYYYFLGMSINGELPCAHIVNDDPYPNHDKACYLSQPNFIFSGIEGRWEKIYSCIGCESFEYEITIGITDIQEEGVETTHETLTSNTKVSSWEASLSVSVEAYFVSAEASATFGGSTEMTKEQAHSATQSIVSTLEKSKEITTSIECGGGIVYQYMLDMTQTSGAKEISFKIRSKDYACLVPGQKPKCPAILCADESCQTCVGDESISSSSRIKPHNNNLVILKKKYIMILISMVVSLQIALFVLFHFINKKCKKTYNYEKVDDTEVTEQ